MEKKESIRIRQEHLKALPGVDVLYETAKSASFAASVPKPVFMNAVRAVIDARRQQILAGAPLKATPADTAVLMEMLESRIRKTMTPNLHPLINATGVVVHTNLGRSLLPPEVTAHVQCVSGSYSNLEFNLAEGKRGIRYAAIEELLCEITGAEAAMAVNNNAGAVLLCLSEMAEGEEAVVSRGELVEIGGAFRIPDVMARSGAILKEVGTTNRTHLRDYENAVGPETGLLLKVHQSNFSIVGFSAAVSLKELVELGRRTGVPVMEDLGSGSFIDFSAYGLIREPTVQNSVAAGTDIVTFSGDKLLGGPQAGLIVGKKIWLDRIKKNPLTRALRIDKMTLAALEAVLRLYRDPKTAVRNLPTLRMLTCSPAEIAEKADRLEERLASLGNPRLEITARDHSSRVGGGSLPLQELPTRCVGVRLEGISAHTLEKQLRKQSPPVIGRIENDLFLMDLRTVAPEELPLIEKAFRSILSGENSEA